MLIPNYKNNIASAFNRAAMHYDQAAYLQNYALTQLTPMIQSQRPAHHIIDLGAGTGLLSKHLISIFPHAHLWLLDLARNMLTQAQYKLNHAYYIQGDIDQLPIKSTSIDLVTASLSFQWTLDLALALRECQRILNPAGQLCFSTLGSLTFNEIHAVWHELDPYQHANQFHTAAMIEHYMHRSGFTNLEIKSQPIKIYFPTFNAMLNNFKQTGTYAITQNGRKGLMGKKAWQQFKHRYTKQINSMLIYASYELILVSGYKK